MFGVFLLAAFGLWCMTAFALLSITAAIVGVSRWLSTRKAKRRNNCGKACGKVLDLDEFEAEWREL